MILREASRSYRSQQSDEVTGKVSTDDDDALSEADLQGGFEATNESIQDTFQFRHGARAC